MKKQTKPAPKQSLTAEQRMALATNGGIGFAKGDALNIEAIKGTIQSLTGATFTEWEGARMSWVKGYRDERGVDEPAATVAWGRMLKTAKMLELDVPEKPKAATGEAQKKQAQREAQRAEMQGLDVATINVEIAEQAPKAAQGDSKAFSRVKALRAELDRRAKETSKGAQETEKKLRADIAATLKGLSLENLHRVQAFLGTLGDSITSAPVVAPEKKARTLKKAA